MDALDVLIEVRDETAFNQAVKELEAPEQQIKAYVGVSCKIAALQPNSVERTQTGKARPVVDK